MNIWPSYAGAGSKRRKKADVAGGGGGGGPGGGGSGSGAGGTDRGTTAGCPGLPSTPQFNTFVATVSGYSALGVAEPDTITFPMTFNAGFEEAGAAFGYWEGQQNPSDPSDDAILDVFCESGEWRAVFQDSLNGANNIEWRQPAYQEDKGPPSNGWVWFVGSSGSETVTLTLGTYA